MTAASLRPWPRTVRVQGSLIEDEQAQVGAKAAGRVKDLLVDLGTTVRQGQPLVNLETEEFDLRVQQAQAQVAQVRATLGLKPGSSEEKIDPERAAPVLQEKALLDQARFNLELMRRLRGKSVGTQEELKQREAELGVADARYASSLNTVQEQIALLRVRRAELALAQQALADAQLKAPFSGMIQECRVAPGSYVAIGDPVVTLVRIDPLRFRAGVPERSSTNIHETQLVRVFLEGQSAPVEARISRISPALETSSRSLIVEADIPNPGARYRAGLFAEAEIVVNPVDRALAIPQASVVTFGGVEKVWVVRGNQAESQKIRTGRRQGSLVEVMEGLADGDKILADGSRGHAGIVQVSHEPPRDAPADRRALVGH